MNAFDEAVEAGARAFYEHPGGMTDWQRMARVEPDLAGRYREAMTRAARAAWPVLSAGLRELHKRYQDRYATPYCGHCRGGFWPCPTMQEILSADRALGIGEDVTE